MPRPKPINPFYVLLVLVGIVFCVTASAYGLMTFRATQADATALAADQAHPLWAMMDSYGTWALVGELVVLGICTFGAIGTDEYWAARAAREQNSAREDSA